MKVLAVCTGNTCRSQMFEFMLGQIARKKHLDIQVDSAGLSAVGGTYTEPDALDVLRAHGIDCERRPAKNIDVKMYEAADAVIAIAQNHAAALKNMYGDSKVICLSDFSSVPLTDPYGKGRQAYEDTYKLIAAALPSVIAILTKTLV